MKDFLRRYIMAAIDNNERNFVEWDDKYSIGVPVIDAQHKELVKLCNDLYIVVMSDRTSSGDSWKQAFNEAVKKCVNYCLIHFRDEELLQKASGYKRYEEHKQLHQEFVEKVKKTILKMHDVSISEYLGFVNFLKDWIFTHIAYEDKLIAKSVQAYLKERKENQ